MNMKYEFIFVHMSFKCRSYVIHMSSRGRNMNGIWNEYELWVHIRSYVVPLDSESLLATPQTDICGLHSVFCYDFTFNKGSYGAYSIFHMKTRKNQVGWKIPKQCWIVGPTGLRKSIGNTSDRYLWSTQCVLLRFFVNKGNLWSIQLIPHENKKEKSWMKNSKTLLDSGTHWTQKLYWQHFRQISVVYTVCFVTIFSVNKGFYGAYSLFHMKTRKNKVGW